MPLVSVPCHASRGLRRRLLPAAVVAVSLTTFIPAVVAADWLNPAGGNWDDPANWSGSTVPGSTQSANFGLASTYDVSLPLASVVVGGAGVTKGDVGFVVPPTGVFQAYGFAVDGAQARVFGGGHAVIGDLDSIFNAGAFSVDRGSLLISGAGTVVEAANDLEIGSVAGAATLTVFQDGVAELGRIRAATHADAHAWLTVRDNENTSLLRGKAAVLGVAGAATLSIVNEGRYNADALGGLPALTVGATDGNGARGRGFVLVDGNKSLMRIKGEIRIGDGGDGTMLVSNAGRAAFSGVTRLESAAVIGANGGNGHVRVTGAASSLRLNGTMAVYQNNDFTPVVVDDGGLIRAERMVFRDDTAGGAATPVATVSGSGSTLSSPGKIDVRSGRVRIDDGAVMEAGIGLRIAEESGRRARVEFNGGTLRVGELTMSGGDLVLSPGTDKIVRTGRVFFYSPNGQIDLSDNAMMLDYFEFETSPLEGVRQAIGSRIVSSVVAGDPERFALGTAEGSDLPSVGGGVRTFFRESVDNTAVLVRFTYKGDATLDGSVNISDFALLAAHFNRAGRWFNGDFTNDGLVNTADFAAMALNFGQSLPSSSGGSARPGAVPEPSALALLVAVAAGALRRRRQTS